MTLYEINSNILNLIDENGEITDLEKFENLQLDKEEKIDNCIKFYKNLSSDIEQLKQEEDKLAKRRKVKENTAKYLKEMLSNELAGQKLETPQYKIIWRKSSKLIVDDIEKISSQYLIAQAPKVDTQAIKQDIKNGLEVDGVHMEESNNIQIK